MIKKTLTVLIALLVLCLAAGCSTPKAAVGSNIYVGGGDIDKNLRYFLGIDDAFGNEISVYGTAGDRYPGSKSENAAAKKLAEHFSGERYSRFKVTDLDYTSFLLDDETVSYNVEIKYNNEYYSGNKRVIIAAGYDNPYKMGIENVGDFAIGAFTATGTAAVMSIMDYLSTNPEVLKDADFNITFLFMGASYANFAGAVKYLTGTISADELNNTIAAFELKDFGGERTYMYADDVSTSREKFFKNVIGQKGINCYSLPANMPVIDGAYKKGVYFAHTAMFGSATEFAERGIPSFSLFSGYYGGFCTAPIIKRGIPNVTGTYKDTYSNLKSNLSGYATEGGDAANAVIAVLSASGFSDSIDGKSVYDYKFVLNPMWAYIAVLLLLIACGVTVILLVKRFERKYPFKPVIKRMRIAVFGMEYEDAECGDLFVDIKPKNPFAD